MERKVKVVIGKSEFTITTDKTDGELTTYLIYSDLVKEFII